MRSFAGPLVIIKGPSTRMSPVRSISFTCVTQPQRSSSGPASMAVKMAFILRRGGNRPAAASTVRGVLESLFLDILGAHPDGLSGAFVDELEIVVDVIADAGAC